jgi:hypothetical protein
MNAPLRALAFAALLAASAAAAAEDVTPTKNAGPYVPSPDSVVSSMLKEAGVGPNDYLIDLGSGDGRIVLTAAKLFGASGFGVEIKDELVRKANEDARAQGLADRVKFVKQDLFKTDISKATVVTMYLLPDTVNLLKDKFLAELRPGTRIVSHDYPLTGWLPKQYTQFDLDDKVAISGVTTTVVYLYVVPAKVAGTWKAQFPPSVSKAPATLTLKQQITRVSGSARIGKKEIPLHDVELRGEEISFKLSGRKGDFTGTVKGRSIEGVVQNGDRRTPWTATRGG